MICQHIPMYFNICLYISFNDDIVQPVATYFWICCHIYLMSTYFRIYAYRYTGQGSSTSISICPHTSTHVSMWKTKTKRHDMSTYANIFERITIKFNICRHIPTCGNILQHQSSYLSSAFRCANLSLMLRRRAFECLQVERTNLRQGFAQTSGPRCANLRPRVAQTSASTSASRCANFCLR
jgi:hypothetical protein